MAPETPKTPERHAPSTPPSRGRTLSGTTVPSSEQKSGDRSSNRSDDEAIDNVFDPEVRPPESEGEDLSEEENEEETDDEDDEDDEQVDEEPQLKYQRLTPSLGTLYRNGDAASCFYVGGDKIIFGTHDGNVVTCSTPSLHPVRVYHAHSATISAISVSPFPVAFPTSTAETSKIVPSTIRTNASTSRTPNSSTSVSSPRTIKQNPVPYTSANSIHIATASIDGHVCVASLVDPKDVTLRNFGRPISAVALSPTYKNDRAYLSGGLAGNLVLTVGGKVGTSVNANSNSAAAAASGWLSSIGLGSGSGTDKVLHSGEGAISAIKWSLSGKFVAWVNEHGVKIMRTGNKLEPSESDHAWTRVGHIDRPKRPNWNEMAAGWKPRLDWIDDATLESDVVIKNASNGTQDVHAAPSSHRIMHRPVNTAKRRSTEKLVIGWGDAIWIVNVKADIKLSGQDALSKSGGTAVVMHHLYLDDCIISGVSLYTPSLLLVLAYRTRDDGNKPLAVSQKGTPRRGVQHRQNGLSPEMRLIDIITKEEVDADTLTMSRYESLSAGDYHLGKIYIPPIPAAVAAQRGTFEAIGGGIWDASVNATRLFSSAASVRSGTGSTESANTSSALRQAPTSHASEPKQQEASPVKLDPGVKVFVLSPFDCVLAQKRDLSDHLTWLLDHKQYKDAWDLVKEHPQIITVSIDDVSSEGGQNTSAVSNGQSLADFLASDTASQTTVSASKSQKKAIEYETRRIGELWINQLVESNEWTAAGEASGRVLGASPRWEHWVSRFAQAGHFDEITSHIPTTTLSPRLPSVVYERLLDHYLNHDLLRFKSLIDNWDPDLYNIENVAEAIQKRLSEREITEDSVEDGIRGRDWRILLDALAKLRLAGGRPEEAIKCHFELHNADDAMNLIMEYNLASSIADNVASFVTLRVSKKQLQQRKIGDIEESSREAIRMLVDESVHGAILPQDVVKQLQDKGSEYEPFIFLYLRALWQGQGTDLRSHRTRQRLELQGRSIVEEFADIAVSLFAEFDRTVLMEFLRYSRSYAYEQATAICERRQYYPELVYLLSQTGQTKRALDLIINSLGDVHFAIEFAKEQEDTELWDDLLEFSMDKPTFIRGLLEGVGTAIDPIKLVRGIPEGLEIEGLRDGIRRMVREYEIQSSISEGVAKVLQGEVASGMEDLRSGRARAVKFELGDVLEKSEEPAVDDSNVQDVTVDAPIVAESKQEPTPGHCGKCRKAFREDDKDILIGFACGHVYHLACMIALLDDPEAVSIAEKLESQIKRTTEDSSETRGVGAKMAHAHLMRTIVGRGCPHCHRLDVE